jgi:uncharacterized protein (TIGR02217 family)
MTEIIMETPRFPDSISYGSSGGPSYSTDIVTVSDGSETRNINWAYPRHSYNVAFGIRNQSYLNNLISFFNSVQGKKYGFRYKDWNDYTGTNQSVIDNGDGTFQIVKSYSGTIRKITKLVSGTVTVSGGGTIDYDTGIITGGTGGTATFEFDVPVRFDTDSLSIVLEMYLHGTTDVPLIEVRV